MLGVGKEAVLSCGKPEGTRRRRPVAERSGRRVCEQAKKLPNELVIDGVSLARSSAILSKGFYLSFFVRVMGSDH